jgi:hypothetical protein
MSYLLKKNLLSLLLVTLYQNSNKMKTLSISSLLFFMMMPLAYCGGGIYGQISNDKKLPYANIEVQLLDSAKQILATVITNIDGQYGFDISEDGVYGLLVKLDEENGQYLSDIVLKDSLQLTYNFIMSDTKKYGLKDFNVLKHQQLERMASTDLTSQVANQSNMKVGQNNTLLSGTDGRPVKMIIDGQVMSDGNMTQFVPGSVNDVQIIKR